MLRNALTLAVLATSLFTVACKKQAPEPFPMEVVDTTRPGKPPVPQAVVDQIKENFSRVHFGYDSSTLDARSKEALAANARLLQQHPSITVEIQGHCDERGTIEYNLALGNRRAQAVRSYLGQVGVSPSRVTTMSFGKERPLANGSGETVWAQNRRAEFRVLTGSDGLVMGTIR